MDKKSLWYEWETVALSSYVKLWYNLVKKNFTIRWGELDLILEDDNNLVFVEVKTVSYIEDLHDYITKNKLKLLEKTIKSYLYKYPTNKDIRLDVVFIKDNQVYQIYQWIWID